ncbi:MAG: 4'-phosphopantetheinyl transferase family protein [Dermatophilaceae bacterium]
MVVVATADRHLGVDVERVAAPETASQVLPLLHPEEQVELRDTGEVGFSRLWVRKEAYLKGIGTGLSRDLALDYLGHSGRHPLPEGWAVVDLPDVEGFVAAVAVRAEAVAVELVPNRATSVMPE